MYMRVEIGDTETCRILQRKIQTLLLAVRTDGVVNVSGPTKSDDGFLNHGSDQVEQ